MNATPILTYLEHLFRDAGVVELRHQIAGRWETTWHAEAEDLFAMARAKREAGNLFTSLNHVSTIPPGPVTNDAVDRYCRLLFDFDPEREKDTSSTDTEVADAKERALGLRRHLSAHGWPMPAIAMSGNGVHLQYRAALPNTDEVRTQLTAIYTGLHERFDDDVVRFDRTVRNPGRICTLYGSTKRKGQPTEDRPHRHSWILIPPDWRQVSAKQVERLANTYAKKPTEMQRVGRSEGAGATIAGGAGDYASLDVVGLFQAHGLYVGWLRDHVHGVRCPWSGLHTQASPANGGDTVIFEQDGSWPGFFCHHSHCVGRNIRDVIALWPDADRFCTRTFVKNTGNRFQSGVRHV
jgi:hypothetical protein